MYIVIQCTCPAATIGIFRRPPIMSGGRSIGVIGRKTFRLITVSLIDSMAAAFERPRVLPSRSRIGTPSLTSGHRVKMTLPAPAVTTAVYLRHAQVRKAPIKFTTRFLPAWHQPK